jgi:HD-GYP domain-containing protein (c-di-GMP phosphodiesterase class II)
MVAMQSQRTAISLNDLRIGFILPVPIHSGSEQKSTLLLNRGMQLTEEAVANLRARGIDEVYVSSHFAAALKKPIDRKVASITVDAERPRAQVVSAAFRPRADISQNEVEKQTLAIQVINERALDLLSVSSIRPNIEGAQEIVQAELKSLKASCDLFLSLGLSTTVDSEADRLHGLRVGRLAMGMALADGRADDEIHQIGLGCLLMDIGLSDEARELRRVPRRLTRLEMLEIEKHPSKTFDILSKEGQISPIARFLAYQVHERCDGSGYPRSRKATGISDGALTAMVAESFVAMISPRPHRTAISPTNAIRQLFQMSNCHKLDPKRVESLVSVVSALPVGTRVKLSNGLSGVVKISRARDPLHPVIEIDTSPDSENLCLLSTSDVKITAVLSSAPGSP